MRQDESRPSLLALTRSRLLALRRPRSPDLGRERSRQRRSVFARGDRVLARRVAPASVKQHRAAQEAEREQRDQAWRDERAASLQRQRDKLAAGESVRCECCLHPIESAADAVEKHGALVHAGDCEQWGSTIDQDEDEEAAE